MFELSLAHLNAAERERDLTTDLRDRRILKPETRKIAQPRQATRTKGIEKGR